MLEYKNKNLRAIDEEITSSDYIIRLDTDLDVTTLGTLIYPNGTYKVIEFINKSDESNIKIARLITTEEDLQYLSSIKFQLTVLNGDLKETSNIIPLKFNKELIKTDIKVYVSKEYKELVEKLAALTDKINSLVAGNLLSSIDILNKNLIKPGMIPVAIDDKGHFAALYPFANNITCINGQSAANGVVEIDASMIKYKESKSIEEAIDDQTTALNALANAVQELSSGLSDIRQHLDEVDLRLTQHINNGII